MDSHIDFISIWLSLVCSWWTSSQTYILYPMDISYGSTHPQTKESKEFWYYKNSSCWLGSCQMQRRIWTCAPLTMTKFVVCIMKYHKEVLPFVKRPSRTSWNPLRYYHELLSSIHKRLWKQKLWRYRTFEKNFKFMNILCHRHLKNFSGHYWHHSLKTIFSHWHITWQKKKAKPPIQKANITLVTKPF